MLLFDFLWNIMRSTQLPECTVTLNLVTHHINTHADTHSEGRGGGAPWPAAVLLTDRRLTFGLALSQHSISTASAQLTAALWKRDESHLKARV